MVRLPNLSKLNFGLLFILVLPASVSGQDAGVDAYGTPAPGIESAGRMRLPEGFRVDLVAAEPDVRQPIALTIDARGRLWVAECYSYPHWSLEGKDRILILEDADGDGRFEKRKVFRDGIRNLTGLELGFGGVWVCSTPEFLFIPDRDGDDVPDGAPEVLLDGWDMMNGQHNVFSTLTWGPDGWLYGCNGILSESLVGRPGTPDTERVPLNCGVWRYHPTDRRFEVVAWGTTNPWGLDFDDHGEMFITNCVIPHLFHVVPGAHFQRMFGNDFNPHLYGLMESCADHIHWAGGAWQSSRGGAGKHGEAGGGHAHVGAMVYLGDNWPERYRGGLFTCNLHGNRVNHDSLERQGSGYVARHQKDFLLAGDAWFRGLELKYGPDGGVFVIDWSDAGECHDTDRHSAHHESGRIYKVSYGQPAPRRVDLARRGDVDLAKLQLHPNDWYARVARRLLQERAATGRDLSEAHRALRRIFETHPDPTRKLRALWALHAIGVADEEFLLAALRHPDESVRGWAIRLLSDSRSPSPNLVEPLSRLAATDSSPRVRLALASALQRLPLDRRGEIARGLVSREVATNDESLQLMIWYGIEPLAEVDAKLALSLLSVCKIPLVREYLARRLASLPAPPGESPPGLVELIKLLGQENDLEVQRSILRGARAALRGRRDLKMRQEWSNAYDRQIVSRDPEVRTGTIFLASLLGDPRALSKLKDIVVDRDLGTSTRASALEALVETGAADLVPILHDMLRRGDLEGPVLRALAAYDDPRTPRLIVERYAAFDPMDRPDAVRTLAARPSWALVLLDAVETGTIPRRDLSAFVARKVDTLGNERVRQRLTEVWRQVRSTSRTKQAAMARYRKLLVSGDATSRDLSNGRRVFQDTCAQCHRLFDDGGRIGPDLTGSNRDNVDYVLENVLDPSALVGRDFRLTTVITIDGRVISGILSETTRRTIRIQTINAAVVLARENVAQIESSNVSLMPEGIFDKLSEKEIRDLVAYLASKEQVPAGQPSAPR